MNKYLTWLEIDSSAINYNLYQFRKLIGKDKLLMPVIKSNAYGHGFLNVAKICSYNKEVDRICVVSLDESLTLIENKINKQIMILSFYNFDKLKLRKAINNKVIFPIYDIKQIRVLNNIAKQIHKSVKVQVEIDTGASRTGVLPKDTLKFIKKIKTYSHLELDGIWSHFAASEENKVYTLKQIKIFNQLIKSLEKNQINIPLKHMACTASSILYPQSHFNGTRLGIGTYGLYDLPFIQKKIKLKPALSWYTRIIQIKTLPPKTYIGYGCTYQTKRKTKLAIIPVGYWDGYDRHLSNKAWVIINNQKCPVRGRICMNLSMVEITNLKNVKTGDKVILLGKSKDYSITAENLAKWANTINYEILTRINPWLPRTII